MHRNKFVLAVRHNGKVLREENKKVFLPFYEEYELLLKNLHNRDAVASVTIDGMDIGEGRTFVVRPNSTMELERFVLDNDLDNGNKFKFVPVTDSAVGDPNSPDNGIIEVRFRLKKKKDFMWTTSCEPHIHYCGSAGNTQYNVTGQPSNVTYDCDMATTATPKATATLSSCSMGATVQGDRSDQKFTSTHIGDLEDEETIIRVQMVPHTKPVESKKHKFCTDCGARCKYKDKYCASCGNKLERTEQ